MGNANMAQDFDNNNESNDLIEELARLMAEDAKEGNAQAAAQSKADNIVDEADVRVLAEGTKNTGIAKTLDSVLSASERLSVTQVAQEVINTNPILGDIANQETHQEAQSKITDTVQHLDENPLSLDDQSPLPEVKNLNETSDPIADLISAQLKEVEDSFSAIETEQESVDILNNEPETLSDQYFTDEIDTEINVQMLPENSDDIASNEFGKHSIFDINEDKQSASVLNNSDPAPIIDKNDPLVEIENLIGEAVKAGVEPLINEPSSAQAYVSPEFASTEVEQASIAAEAAIFAAAKESDIPNQINEEAKHQPYAIAEKSSLLKTFFAPAFAGMALLVIGFGSYWLISNNTPSETPVLTADGTSDKAAPEQSDSKNSGEGSVVMNELSGDKQPTQGEQIVSRDESQSDNPITRIITANETSPTGLVNRPVRTVTVRPDGTIISGDSARAGSEVLPVDRPNIPAIPEGSTNAAAQLVNQPVASQDTIQIASAPVTTPATQPVIVPVPQTRPSSLQVNTPVIAPVVVAPLESNSNAVNLLANSANQATIAINNGAQIMTAPVATAPATLTKAPAYVQISSQRAEETAKLSMSEIKSRFASALGNRNLEIQRADLGDRGIYYRVRVPANSIDDANQICGSIKQAGGDCFVRTD